MIIYVSTCVHMYVRVYACIYGCMTYYSPVRLSPAYQTKQENSA